MFLYEGCFCELMFLYEGRFCELLFLYEGRFCEDINPVSYLVPIKVEPKEVPAKNPLKKWFWKFCELLPNARVAESVATLPRRGEPSKDLVSQSLSSKLTCERDGSKGS